MDGEREVEDFVTIEEENEGMLMTEHMSMIIGQPTLQISLSGRAHICGQQLQCIERPYNSLAIPLSYCCCCGGLLKSENMCTMHVLQE